MRISKCKANGKPSTWLPLEKLVEQKPVTVYLHSRKPLNTKLSSNIGIQMNFKIFKNFTKK